MNKLRYEVDRAVSVHLYAGDTAKLRRLATAKNTNVTNLLRDIIRQYLVNIDGINKLKEELLAEHKLKGELLDRIDTDAPDLELKHDAPPTFAEQLAEDLVAPSFALGHVDPDDEDLDNCVANLIAGGHTL